MSLTGTTELRVTPCRTLAGKVLSRQKTAPPEERQRVQAEAATAQAAAEEARFDLARKLTEVRPHSNNYISM